MKTIALTLIAAGLGFAQSQSGNQSAAPSTDAKGTATAVPATKPKTAPQKPKATPKAQEPVTIPQGATLVEPNLYRYTDAGGKSWMYRQTPFGISKYEDKPAAAPQPSAADSEPVRVVDLGDSVRFEKKTAFGVSKWVRKKTELTDEEKALVAGAASEKKPSENQ
jgi:hypothetical protein